jgi:hypothetical protein
MPEIESCALVVMLAVMFSCKIILNFHTDGEALIRQAAIPCDPKSFSNRRVLVIVIRVLVIVIRVLVIVIRVLVIVRRVMVIVIRVLISSYYVQLCASLELPALLAPISAVAAAKPRNTRRNFGVGPSAVPLGLFTAADGRRLVVCAVAARCDVCM